MYNQNLQKGIIYKFEKAKYFLFEVKRVPYSLVSYVEVGCMIENLGV